MIIKEAVHTIPRNVNAMEKIVSQVDLFVCKMEVFMGNKQNDTELTASLAKNTLDEIPRPKSDAKEIVGLIRHSGKIDGYRLSDNSTVSKAEGVQMAKNGDIKGVGVAHRGDTEYLKSIPDGSENNNLGSLPTVSG